MSTEKATKKKMGRPIIGMKKDIMLRMRIDEDTLAILDRECERKKVSRSDLIRAMIRELEKN